MQSWWKTESFGCKFAEVTSRSVEDKQALTTLQSISLAIATKLAFCGRTQIPNYRTIAWLPRSNCTLWRRDFLETQVLLAPTEIRLVTIWKRAIARNFLLKKPPQRFKKQWFLPHHPVLNLNKPGKVRKVFNAASIFKGTDRTRLIDFIDRCYHALQRRKSLFLRTLSPWFPKSRFRTTTKQSCGSFGERIEMSPP